jgi:hypothetical protein
MKKKELAAKTRRKMTSKTAFLKAVRQAQRRAALAKRTARIAKLQWKAAKNAYKEARDAAQAAKKAVRALQKALPGALRESRRAEASMNKKRG